jgi:hypothetical protein
MEKTERIVNRLPGFYRAWDKQSVLFHLVNSIAKSISEQQKDLYLILRSHWVDAAFGINLDLLGALYGLKRRLDESDDDFRTRIKSTIAIYKGGGTVEAIRTQTSLYLAVAKEDITLIENPRVLQSFDKTIKYGDELFIKSNSISDEDAAIILTLDDENFKDGFFLENPTITDVTNNFSITYDGKIAFGQKLIIKHGKAELNGVDVTGKVSNTKIVIPRRGSRWVYHESLSPLIARFDKDSYFDKHRFAKSIPFVHIRFEWIASLLATFELRVQSNALAKNNVSIDELRELVNAIKAAGVQAIITEVA